MVLTCASGCAVGPSEADSTGVCQGITPEGAEEAYRVAACEYGSRCGEARPSTDECIALWEIESPKLPRNCFYDDFDPCAAEKCILHLTAPRRSCDENLPDIGDCFGMFTSYACADI